MDISNNAIDLLYLTNPNLKVKYNNLKYTEINNDDIKFYRKRILQTTKDYLRGNKLKGNIDNLFLEYCGELIKHYKFIDKKEIIQEEYNNLSKKISKNKKKDKFNLLKKDELIMKEKKTIVKTIKDFAIVKEEKKKTKMIIPEVKKYDLKNEKNRNIKRKKKSK